MSTKRAGCSTRLAGSAVRTASAPRTVKRPKFVFQTSINAPRQKTRAIVKQACQKTGVDVEPTVTASVYFSSDEANRDTARKFYADIQMLTTVVGAPPDPEGLTRQFLSTEIAAKENKWQR